MHEVVYRSVETSIRKKMLYRYRLLGVYFLVSIDGSGVLTLRRLRAGFSENDIVPRRK